MTRVTGIGGIFFKSGNPGRLREWYDEHLGIAPGGEGAAFEWREKDAPETLGMTVWSIFPSSSRYFDPSQSAFMINYRVDDLDRVLKLLREEGVEVDPKVEDSADGRFGWAMDPDGNRFELWEPPRPKKT